MEDCVLDSTNVLIHWHPVIVSTPVQWTFLIIWAGVAIEIPGRLHECVHGIHFSPCGTVTFRALSFDTDTPLPGVEIELEGTYVSDTATSQSPDGFYLFPTNSAGTYTLTVNLASVPTGYQATTSISHAVELTSQHDLDNDFGFLPSSGLTLTKEATPSALPFGGGLVTYTFQVTNTGQTPLSPVTVTDVLLGGVVCVNPPGQDPLLPGDGFTCQTATLILTDTVNVALAEGIPVGPSGNPVPGVVVSGTAQASVVVRPAVGGAPLRGPQAPG